MYEFSFDTVTNKGEYVPYGTVEVNKSKIEFLTMHVLNVARNGYGICYVNVGTLAHSELYLYVTLTAVQY